jgi:hypothetical protein
VDCPDCTFYRELMAAYLDAMVVLSVRDIMRNRTRRMSDGFKYNVTLDVVLLQPIYNHCNDTLRDRGEQRRKSGARKCVPHAVPRSPCHSIKLPNMVSRKLLIDWSQVRALPAEP